MEKLTRKNTSFCILINGEAARCDFSPALLPLYNITKILSLQDRLNNNNSNNSLIEISENMKAFMTFLSDKATHIEMLNSWPDMYL